MSKIIPFPEPARLTFPTPENCEPLSKEEIDAFYDNMFRNEYLRCVFDDILSEAGYECQPQASVGNISDWCRMATNRCPLSLLLG